MILTVKVSDVLTHLSLSPAILSTNELEFFRRHVYDCLVEHRTERVGYLHIFFNDSHIIDKRFRFLQILIKWRLCFLLSYLLPRDIILIIHLSVIRVEIVLPIRDIDNKYFACCISYFRASLYSFGLNPSKDDKFLTIY